MLKKWFPVLVRESPPPQIGGSGTEAIQRLTGVAPAENVVSAKPASEETGPPRSEPAKYVPFEQIYTDALIKPPRVAYGILKVAEMVNSAHLTGMAPDARRCSLLMALEAAGIEIEDLLQDAVVRQKALNDYEQTQQTRLKDLETNNLEENRKIQMELDRLTSQCLARIQTNLDEVAREQDSFRAWQAEKRQESQRITEAAMFCVPQGSAANVTTMTAVLERATFVRR